jgi:L-asparagine transporter-like permease
MPSNKCIKCVIIIQFMIHAMCLVLITRHTMHKEQTVKEISRRSSILSPNDAVWPQSETKRTNHALVRKKQIKQIIYIKTPLIMKFISFIIVTTLTIHHNRYYILIVLSLIFAIIYFNTDG